MGAVVYSTPTCPYCVRAKALLTQKNIPFTEVIIGRDMLHEEFFAQYPNQRTVPLIFLDEQRIGGYDDLVAYFKNQPNLLLD